MTSSPLSSSYAYSICEELVSAPGIEFGGTHLSSAGVKHSQVLASHNVDQLTRLNVSDLDEIRLECQDVRIVEGERLWCSLPLNSPVLSRTPAISVDEEGELRIVEQEFAIETLNVDWLDVLAACDKVQRSIGLVKK